jgi:hypothetical protein
MQDTVVGCISTSNQSHLQMSFLLVEVHSARTSVGTNKFRLLLVGGFPSSHTCIHVRTYLCLEGWL